MERSDRKNTAKNPDTTHDLCSHYIAWSKAGPNLRGCEGSARPSTAAEQLAHLDRILCRLPDILRPNHAHKIWPTGLAVDGQEGEGCCLASDASDGADDGRIGFWDGLLVVLAEHGDDTSFS